MTTTRPKRNSSEAEQNERQKDLRLIGRPLSKMRASAACHRWLRGLGLTAFRAENEAEVAISSRSLSCTMVNSYPSELASWELYPGDPFCPFPFPLAAASTGKERGGKERDIVAKDGRGIGESSVSSIDWSFFARPGIGNGRVGLILTAANADCALVRRAFGTKRSAVLVEDSLALAAIAGLRLR